MGNLNKEKYKHVIEDVVKLGKIGNHIVNSKGEAYCYLSERLNISYDTARKGPQSPDLIRELGEILGTSLFQEDTKLSITTNMSTCSEYVKNSIGTIYSTIMDYLQSDFPEDEDRYVDLCNSIERLKIGIPPEIYTQIQEFIKVNLEPTVYDYVSAFHEEFSDEFGYWDENGSFQIAEPVKEHSIDILEIHFSKILEIQKKFDDFAMKYMQPYIL